MKKTLLIFSKKVLPVIIILSPFISFSQFGKRVKLSIHGMTAALNEDMGRCIAASNDTLHVVWHDHRTQGHAIYYTRSIDTGVTWTMPINITDTMGKAIYPCIAVSGKNIHVVWLDTLKGLSASYYIHSIDGGNTWSPKMCLDTNTKYWPSVAASGTNVYVAFNKLFSQTPYNTEIYLARSLDNGTTWSAEQLVSNANGRSEDQSIEVKGSHIHMSWNDNRTGIMQIYSRESYDGGATWANEMQVSNAVSPNSCYTTMTSLDGNNVDIVYGQTTSSAWDVWLRPSSDTGTTWSTGVPITNANPSGLYPHMVRSGNNLFVAYMQIVSPAWKNWYLNSTDGGMTWSAPVQIDFGGQPFLALTGCALHVIYPDSGAIYYRRNPNAIAGCNLTAIADEKISAKVSVFPNPFSESTNMKIVAEEKIENAEFKIINIYGECILQKKISAASFEIDLKNQPKGIYFYEIKNETEFLKGKLISQ